jgi:hypothetical protein
VEIARRYREERQVETAESRTKKIAGAKGRKRADG